MLRFDTLKIAFPNLSLDTVNYSAFAAYPSSKHVDRKNYYLSNPCPGVIKISIGDTETAVEFSAKILKADYPQLLSSDTIQQALTNLLADFPGTFSVQDVLRLAHVLKAHQTHSFALSQPFAAYATPLVNLHVNREYRPQTYKDETLTYLQNATGKGREYFKIYDKAKEYARPANAEYRNSLTAAERKTVAAYFAACSGWAETEINGKRKLRQYFPDIDLKIMLTDLLQSTSNPLATQFAEITKEAYAAIEVPAAKTLAFADTLSYKDAPDFSFLKEHGFDLEKIDARLKALNVPSRTVSRERKKYAGLLASYLAHETPSPSVGLLHELKDAITIGEDTPHLADTTVPPATTETAVPNLADCIPATTPAITIGNHTPHLADSLPLTTPAITIATPSSNLMTSPFPTSTPEADAAFFALLDSLAQPAPAASSLW